MFKNKKHIVLLIWITLLFSGTTYGEQVVLELNANSNDVEGKVDIQFPAYEALVSAGGSVIVSSDNYSVGDIHFIVKDEVFTPALTLGLGFKGVMGQVEIHDFDFDLGAVGFVLLGEYDLRQIYPKIPLCGYANISFSPSPLSFGETESYVWANLGLRAYIVKQAAAVIGYRYLETKFEDDPGEKKESFNAIFFGLQLTF